MKTFRGTTNKKDVTYKKFMHHHNDHDYATMRSIETN